MLGRWGLLFYQITYIQGGFYDTTAYWQSVSAPFIIFFTTLKQTDVAGSQEPGWDNKICFIGTRGLFPIFHPCKRELWTFKTILMDSTHQKCQ